MEYVEGFSLSEEILRRGRIPEKELLPLLDPILTALEKVHESGILHRDIAPDNIMIENGKPVLVDFGAARLGESHASSLLIGNRGYSSPEQMAGEELDPRSDIYSLGATYYKALSGINPQGAMARMRNDQVVPLHALASDVSQAVSDAVMKAMSVDPDKRFASVAEFRTRLQTPQSSASLKVGDMISFGRYEQDNNLNNGAELIEWQVLAIEQGTCDQPVRAGRKAI